MVRSIAWSWARHNVTHPLPSGEFRNCHTENPVFSLNGPFWQTVTVVPVQTGSGWSEQHGGGRNPQIHRQGHQGMRLARSGVSDESARRSLMKGKLPSTLPVPTREGPRRLAANARAAVMDKMADQRSARAEVHAAREGAELRHSTGHQVQCQRRLGGNALIGAT